MILLSGHSLAVNDRFKPERMALNLGERDSTATLTLGTDAPVIQVDNWMKDDTEPGKGIVWRVRAVDTQFNTETRTIALEHAISTLKDRLMFGEVTPKTMGAAGDTISARNAAAYVLSQQQDWVLGDFEYDVSNPYNFNGDDLFTALETISSSLADCIWEYDFSVYPFRLHVRHLPADIGSEMRMSRNITTLKKTVDRSRMFTRFYPIGKNNLHISGNGYVSRNENLYGTVSKVETDQTLTTEAQLVAWANERLNRHAEPVVTVTISGLELSEATGEPLDHFVIGRICRVPLPEFSTAITERVKKLSWPDKLLQAEVVTVTLANELQDVAKILKQQNSSGGRAARAGAKNSEEDHAWFVDTTDKVSMVAEAVAGKDRDGKANWSRVTELTVDGNGIDGRVTHAEGEIVDAEARITVTEEAITQEVSRATGAESSISGRVQVNANKVSLVVEEKNGQNVIKAASIVTEINRSGSSVGISADHVFITGSTKLSGQLTVSDGSLMVKTALLVSGSAANGNVSINNGAVNAKTHQVNSGGKMRFVGSGSGEYYDLTAEILKGMIKTAVVEDNVLTLTPFYGDPINFSKATSLTGGWSGSVYRVNAVQNGVNVGHLDYDPPMRLNGTAQYSNFSAEITETTGSSTVAKKSIYGYLIHHSAGASSYVDVNTKSDGSGDTVARISIGADYSTWWNAGYDDARGKVQMPASGGDAETFDVKVPNAARNGQDTRTFTIVKGATPASSGYVSVTLDGNRVGRIAIGDWYTAGWNDGYDDAKGKVNMPGAGTGESFNVLVPNAARTGQDTRTFTITKGATPAASGYAAVNLDGNVVGRIAIGDWYSSGRSAGWSAAYGTVAWPSAAPAGSERLSFSVTTPDSTENTSSAKTFTMSKGTPSSDGGFASVSLSGTVVGRINIGDWWDAGWNAGVVSGRNGVNIIKGSWSNAQIEFTKSAGTANTQGVKVGASGSWSGGNYTAKIKDYYNDPSGVETGYTVTTDIGSPSTTNPSAQPSTASLSGRTQVGTNDLSKASLSGPGYIFFSITVRGKELKYYIKIKA